MSQAREFAIEVVQSLRAAGYAAYWAGGCVRDGLLNRLPKDYDVATSAQPDEIRAVFGRRRTLAIGAAFGVITVLGRQGQGQIEVATFRQDAAYSDGRHPDSVAFSTPEHDAARRDFTVNGLFYDPIDERVIDFVGGQDDLQAKIIRAIGDPEARIDEDKLRMLRAVRFAATYAFEIETDTLAAIQHHAGELQMVSAERIAEEMRRMLSHIERARAVQLLRDARLSSVVLPELDAPAADEDRWRHMLAILRRLGEQGTFASALAVLLRGVDATDRSSLKRVRQVAARWRLASEERDRAAMLLSNESLIRHAQDAPWPALQRVLIADGVDELMHYGSSVANVLGDDDAQIEYCRGKLALPPEQLNPPPLITGNDLSAAGIPPGKAYRELLLLVRDAQLEGQIDSADDALQLAKQYWTVNQ